MPSVGTASLDVVVDKQQVGRSITAGVEGASGHVANAGRKIATALVASFAAVGVGQQITSSIAEASDLNETVSKTRVVFGAAAGDVLKFGETSAKALGQSKNEALGAAATYGNLFRALGIAEGESAKMSTSLVTLAGDLASFNNVSPTEALDALRSGLTGETEPLKRFGVNLNETTLKAKAMQLGLSDGKGVLDANAKAHAAYALILEQTQLAQGDFARTSGGLANQQRILGAQWTDMKAKLGTALLPLITKVVTFFNNVLPGAVSKIGTTLKVFFGAFRDPDITSSGFFGQVEAVAGKTRQVFDTVMPKVKVFADWLQNNWPTAVKIAVAAFLLFTGPITFVVSLLAILYFKFQWFRDGVGTAIDFVVTKARQFGSFIGEVLPQVQEAIGHFVAVVQAAWRLWGDDILRVVQAVWGQIQVIITTAVTIVENVIRVVLAVINGDWGKAWDGIKAIVGGVWEGILGTIRSALGAFSGLFGGALDAAGRAVGAGFDKIVEVVGGLGGRIGRAAAGMWDGIKNAFKSAINWVIRAWNRLEFKIPGFDPPGPGPKFGGFTLGVPDIKELHTGGVFRTDVPGGEGLALLRDRERVLTPEQDRMFGGQPFVIQLTMDGRVLGEVTSEQLAQRQLEHA